MEIKSRVPKGPHKSTKILDKRRDEASYHILGILGDEGDTSNVLKEGSAVFSRHRCRYSSSLRICTPINHSINLSGVSLLILCIIEARFAFLNSVTFRRRSEISGSSLKLSALSRFFENFMKRQSLLSVAVIVQYVQYFYISTVQYLYYRYDTISL